jgi:uncharacterized membrane protein YgdD (TMEM256/DUF423 family)
LSIPQVFFLLAGLSGAVAVALGAMAAHALRARLDPALLHAFQTGVEYHIYHTLALFGVALWCRLLPRTVGWNDPVVIAGLMFTAGIVAFSGSLYLLALGGPRWLGPITPLGGVAFIGGWLMLAFAAWRGV